MLPFISVSPNIMGSTLICAILFLKPFKLLGAELLLNQHDECQYPTQLTPKPQIRHQSQVIWTLCNWSLSIPTKHWKGWTWTWLVNVSIELSNSHNPWLDINLCCYHFMFVSRLPRCPEGFSPIMPLCAINLIDPLNCLLDPNIS